MDAGADGGKLWLGSSAGLDFEGSGDGEARLREHGHEGVADLLDDPTLPAMHGLADKLGEALEHACCGIVAHGRGERREAREVDEGDGAGEFTRPIRWRQQTGFLGDMVDEVFAEGPLPAESVEVEDHRFHERGRLVAGSVHSIHQRASGEARGPQSFVDVEVEETRLHLGDPAKRVGKHSRSLDQLFAREPEVDQGFDDPHTLEVLLADSTFWGKEAGGGGDLAHHLRIEADDFRGFRHSHSGCHTLGEDEVHVALDQARLALGLGDRLNRDAAAQAKIDEAHTFCVFERESLAFLAPNQAQRAPLAQSFLRQAAVARELFQRKRFRHRAAPARGGCRRTCRARRDGPAPGRAIGRRRRRRRIRGCG